MYKVLLVEDELLVRTGMKSLIQWERHGFELTAEAAHGKEALAMLERHPIDIVITDIRMPVMDGLAFIEQVKSMDYPCEIIVLSSYDDFPYVKKAMQLQARDYIHKPTMTPNEMMETLQKAARHLESRRKEAAFQQLYMDTFQETRLRMLEKWLEECLGGYVHHDRIDDMYRELYVVRENVHMAVIRVQKQPVLMETRDGMIVQQSEDQWLQISLSEYNASHSDRLIYCLAYRDTLVCVLPEEAKPWLVRICDELGEREHLHVFASVSGQPFPIRELADHYVSLRQELDDKLDKWRRLNQMHPMVQEAIRYIGEHYMDNLTLEQISSHIHVSPVYFSRLFLKEFGQTFIDYLTHYRVKQAKMLLTYTDLRTYEISEKVGYRNSKYFLKVFKKLTGMTPGEYKEQCSRAKE